MIAAIIPARNEAERLAATIAAASQVADTVVVVDDGSSDGTADVARTAGATVLRHDQSRGKAAALTTGAAAVPDADVLLLLDADLGPTAREATRLLAALADADCAIALLPKVAGAGGHGFVVRLAQEGIRRATGFTPSQPLSGQRAITRAAFEAVLPLARGFGVETGMTIDLLRQGFRVVEVETAMAHRVTGRHWRDQWHRARQYRDVRRALRARRTSPTRG